MNTQKVKTQILLFVLLAVACSGQRFPAPDPLAPADLEHLTLVPYTDSYQGFHSVAPEGWFSAMPGVVILISGPPETRPGAALILHLEWGAALRTTAEPARR